MKFRKKPVVIEAERFLDSDDWLPFKGHAHYRFSDDHALQVWDELHSTWVTFKDGDWIIKGLKGEFYPCVNDVFRASYDQEV